MKKKRLKTATIPDRIGPAFLIAPVVACLLLLPIISAPAQGRDHPNPGDYALIFGTVWGPDDRPVYGVEVKIRRADEKKARWEVYSNHLGEFEQRVPVGKQDYVLWTDLKGFKPPKGQHLRPGEAVTVHIESDERVDTGLHLK